MHEIMPEKGEGGLRAPTRHPLNWRDPAFCDGGALFAELERIFNICHGCRRCLSLCHAFPTLFDLVDHSSTKELNGVARDDYWKVVEQCYLCDLCYQTKCPYVPPHPWNVDFPHLMLRAKHARFLQGMVSRAQRVLTGTTALGRLASIPVIAETVNAANRSPAMRAMTEKLLGVHRDAELPAYHHPTARQRLRELKQTADETRGRVAIFATCYGNYNLPQAVEDLAAVLIHNGIRVKLIERERCCGMPKLEIGDLESVDRCKRANLPVLAQAARDGWDLIAPVPSCVLMFKQEIPLMYPDEPDVAQVKARIFDPFEYLMHRHKAGLLNTAFRNALGKVAYHAPCHQRVQNVGPKTRELLALIPGTKIEAIERCSGHDGTYGVRRETYELSMKLVQPLARCIVQSAPDWIASDCPMAAGRIAHGTGDGRAAHHPITLLRRAYGI